MTLRILLRMADGLDTLADGHAVYEDKRIVSLSVRLSAAWP